MLTFVLNDADTCTMLKCWDDAYGEFDTLDPTARVLCWFKLCPGLRRARRLKLEVGGSSFC